jgi:hypothetical protein
VRGYGDYGGGHGDSGYGGSHGILEPMIAIAHV